MSRQLLDVAMLLCINSSALGFEANFYSSICLWLYCLKSVRGFTIHMHKIDLVQVQYRALNTFDKSPVETSGNYNCFSQRGLV